MSSTHAHLIRAALGLALALFVAGPAGAETEPFSAGVLGGVARLHVAVEGVPDDFARYGLTADELARRARLRLDHYGIEVVDRATALADPAASELRIKLNANEDPYAFYFYRIGIELRRKRAITGTAAGFVPEIVWSEGQSGVINPSDLPRMYGFVDALLDKFIATHDRQNALAGY
jgi:hypothetical protein